MRRREDGNATNVAVTSPAGHEGQVGAVSAGEGDRPHGGAHHPDAHRLETCGSAERRELPVAVRT